jgi:hypothetical protein
VSIFNHIVARDNWAILKGPYLGQKPPRMTAELFSPGIFFKGQHLGCSGFLNKGTVFVFGSMKPNSDWRLRPVYVMELKNGRWTRPQIATFSRYAPYNFTVGPDGQIIYFTSLKSPDKTTSMFGEQANIWAVKLEMNGWTTPVMFGKSINTERYYENYPSVTNEGTVYYMSRRRGGIGRTDVYKSRNLDGVYAEAENLGPIINTEKSDVDPFVAPDESYLIVCQEKKGGYGGFDLYIYFRKLDGSWIDPVNMGEGINSSSFEARPCVTPDGKYLFFTSNRPDNQGLDKIYWVDAKIIEELKPE